MDVSENGGFSPQNSLKMIIFNRKTLVVWDSHHLRKHPYMRFINVYHGLSVLHIVSKLVE